MATNANISIPKKQWVSINALIGVGLGDDIVVQNLGTGNLYVNTGPSSPTDLSAYNKIAPGEQQIATAETGESQWVYSHKVTRIQAAAY